MKFLRCLLTTTAILALPAAAEVIGVDQFEYPDGAIAGRNGGTFWNFGNIIGGAASNSGSPSAWNSNFGAASVSSGRLVTNGTSALRKHNGVNETDGAVTDGNDRQHKIVYHRVSFTTGSTVPTTLGVATYAFGDKRVFFGKRSDSPFFGIETFNSLQIANSTPPIAVAADTPYTIVCKVDYVNDRLSLFINPPLGGTEPANPDAVVTGYSSSDFSTSVELSSTGGSLITWDNLVVATSWAELGTVVTTLNDEDDGASSLNTPTDISLREAVKYSSSGSLITFAPGLSGQTITLTHPNGEMPVDRVLTIDAAEQPRGLTVNGGNSTRHFQVQGGKSLTLRGLTLTGGRNANDGGSILNSGSTTLAQCTLSGNSAGINGGSISNSGTLTLIQSTLSGNSAGTNGGAISNGGTLALIQSTLSANSASSNGGAISTGGGTLTLDNSIVAGNSLGGSGSGADIFNTGTVNREGTNLVQSLASSGSGTVTGSGTINTAVPKLSPLASYGGPVQTMHPLVGSPAIDAIATSNPGGTDARGFPRFVNGDDSGGAQLDIGAVEAGPVLRLDNATEPALRSLIQQAGIVSTPGVRISFNIAPGSTIALTGDELAPAAAKMLFLDASSIPGGVAISGSNARRAFNIPATATVAMHSLKIVNGRAPNGQNGGGILNSGTCTLLASTLTGNATLLDGGGIFNTGTCTLLSSTLTGNSADEGGGIHNQGTFTLVSTTLSGNSASSSGGGIYNLSPGTCIVLSSTLSGNSANSGGGIFNNGTCRLNSSIVAGNTASTNANISGTLATNTNNLTSGDPRLAPLGDYGGPTHTMALRLGSLARDAAAGSTRITDQRGYPMVGTPDIGAYEAGNARLTNYNIYIWETLPATATTPQTATTFDFDGDGHSNETEWLTGSDAGIASSIFRVTGVARNGGNLVISFPSVVGKTYTLWQNNTLNTAWTNTNLTPVSGDGSVKTFTVAAPFTGVPKRFYRVAVNQP